MSGKPNPDKDERVKLSLDPETALRALLAVNPDDEPAEDNGSHEEAPRDSGGAHGRRRGQS
jgi:hypothetical protein